MNPNTPDHDPALQRVDALHRQQLSALIDGELSADQARFLIRRLEHDQELSACQERWQMAGDVLRGQLGAVAPPDFAARVALALPPVTVRKPSVQRRPYAWFAGGALAAGLAMFAVVLLPGRMAPAVSPAPVLAQVAPSAAPTPAAPSPALPVASVVAAPVAAPASQRRVASAPPARVMPIPSRVPAAAAPMGPAVVAEPAQVAAHPENTPVSPFALPAAPLQARPWPRSPLSRQDVFNARLPGNGSPFSVPQERSAGSWQDPVRAAPLSPSPDSH